MIRWGILGTGLIAGGVLPRIREAQGCTVTAVASRDVARARAFAEAHGLPPSAGCHNHDLMMRLDVDAVYITLPNHLHYQWCSLLLAVGKHVLCEKPLVASEHAAEGLASLSSTSARLCVEGLMWLHHPQTDRLVELARTGDDPDNPIGTLLKVRVVRNALQTDPHIQSTRLSHAMQGGSVMDLGCYCVSAGRLITGEEPAESTLAASAEFAEPLPGEPRGVDHRAAFSWMSASGVRVECECSFIGPPKVLLELVGERGRAWTEWPFSPHADRQTLHIESRGRSYDEVFELPGDKFTRQFERFARAARGEDEPYPSIEWSVGQARVMEAVLTRVGLRFDRSTGLTP